MINSGMMGMPLHFGKMPKWLTSRMGKLGSAIIESVAQNYGKSEVLTRLSDPNWFQALGAVMGMQWDGTIGVGSPADFVVIDASSWTEALTTKTKRQIFLSGKWLEKNEF